ncbi:MAG: hypothetical protein GX130_05495 [Candidatus Hydrogenedens sp.]|jgi:hypothetical protein|nr:hypothetical protein [Candidatus Hydrogenedens sp.]
MKRNCCAHLIAAFVLTVTASSFVHADEAQDILDAVKKAFNWHEHVAFHATCTSVDADLREQYIKNSDFHNNNGEAISIKSTVEVRSTVTGEAVEDTLSFVKVLLKEKGENHFYDFQIGPPDESGDLAFVTVYEDGPEAYNYNLPRELSIAPFFGFDLLFSDKSIPELLSSDNVIIREDMLNEDRSLVLEATVPEGQIKLWVSPDKDYVMQKCILTKEAGRDLFDGTPLVEESFPDSSGTLVSRKRFVTELNVHATEYTDGHHIPVSLERLERQESEEGRVIHEHSAVHSLSEIDFDPDFDALKAFELPEVTGPAQLRKAGGQGISGFRWEDRELVADASHKVNEERLHTAIAQLEGNKDSKEMESAAAVALQLGDSAGQETSNHCQSSVYVWVGGVVLVLICGALGFVVYRTGKKRRSSAQGDES